MQQTENEETIYEQTPKQTPEYFEYILNVDDDKHELDIRIRISKEFLKSFKEKYAKDPLANEFSLEEDKLLLFEHLINSTEDSQVTGADLKKAYKAARKKNPSKFPKANVTGKQLKNRLSQIVGERYSILSAAVSEAVQIELRQREARKKLEEERGKASSAKKTPQTKKKRRQTKLYVDSTISEQAVEICMKGDDIKETTFKTTEKKLAATSGYFKKLLKETEPNENGVKKITINLQDPKWEKVNLYSSVHPDNFKRFIMFCDNPDLQEKFFKVREKLHKFNQQNKQLLEYLQKEMQKEIDDKMSKLQELIDQERQEMLRVIQECEEYDIGRIKMLYEMHRRNELKRLDLVVKERKERVKNFFDKELEQAKTMYETQQQLRKTTMENEVKQYSALMNDILPKDQIVSILILAEILNANELRQACLKVICEDFETYRTSDALGSPLILNETMELIMTKLSTDTLKDLMKNVNYKFSPAFVRKEINYRKEILADEYRQYSIEKLIDIQDKHQSPFPDVLQTEIEKRKSDRSFVHIDWRSMSPYLSVDSTYLELNLIRHQRYATAHATQSRYYEGWGKWYWEAKVIEFHAGFGSTISIGWDVPRQSLDGAIPGLSPGERDQFGFAWQSDGLFHYNGKGEYIGSTYGKGDVIGCALDQDKKTVTFYKNGEIVSLFPKDRRMSDAKFISIRDEIYTLIPAVCLYSSKSGSIIKVKTNFSGPFEYPIPQFHDPYGSERKYRSQQKKIQTTNEGWGVFTKEDDSSPHSSIQIPSLN